jgi:hypothetical protein
VISVVPQMLHKHKPPAPASTTKQYEFSNTSQNDPSTAYSIPDAISSNSSESTAIYEEINDDDQRAYDVIGILLFFFIKFHITSLNYYFRMFPNLKNLLHLLQDLTI